MKRLYCLVPTENVCATIVNELEDDGIPKKHMHVIAKSTHLMQELPEANIWQKTEMGHALEVGVGLGGTAGLFGGLLSISFPVGCVVLGGGAVVAATAAGAGYGAVVSSFMNGYEKNHNIEDFEDDIEAGKLLLLIDVSKKQLNDLLYLVERINHRI